MTFQSAEQRRMLGTDDASFQENMAQPKYARGLLLYVMMEVGWRPIVELNEFG